MILKVTYNINYAIHFHLFSANNMIMIHLIMMIHGVTQCCHIWVCCKLLETFGTEDVVAESCEQ